MHGFLSGFQQIDLRVFFHFLLSLPPPCRFATDTQSISQSSPAVHTYGNVSNSDAENIILLMAVLNRSRVLFWWLSKWKRDPFHSLFPQPQGVLCTRPTSLLKYHIIIWKFVRDTCLSSTISAESASAVPVWLEYITNILRSLHATIDCYVVNLLQQTIWIL